MRESCPESLCIGIPPDFEVMIQQPVKFRIRISSAEGLMIRIEDPEPLALSNTPVLSYCWW
jgi:hypothetical protein